MQEVWLARGDVLWRVAVMQTPARRRGEKKMKELQMLDGKYYARCKFCGKWVEGQVKCCDDCARIEVTKAFRNE